MYLFTYDAARDGIIAGKRANILPVSNRCNVVATKGAFVEFSPAIQRFTHLAYERIIALYDRDTRVILFTTSRNKTCAPRVKCRITMIILRPAVINHVSAGEYCASERAIWKNRSEEGGEGREGRDEKNVR